MMDELTLLALVHLEESEQVREYLCSHRESLETLDLNTQDEAGRTLLHYFCTDLETVRVLLEAGANPNIRDTEKGETPLHIAVRKNEQRCVDLLLAAGANPLILNAAQETSLFLAASQRNVPLLVLMTLRLDLEDPAVKKAFQVEARRFLKSDL